MTMDAFFSFAITAKDKSILKYSGIFYNQDHSSGRSSSPVFNNRKRILKTQGAFYG